ncbi:DUF4363 family protein [Oceanobacillus massiliensis]|uniref:DUF4363 family protein n=1 Tax=Oceanobacillus massiliensis TaxID=1465765 RepID=UPI000287F21C|nr:DUF4363 family protein [Oceanobacillus massiliensis]
MIKKAGIYLLVLVALSGCAGKIGGDYFFNQIDQLEQALDDSEWKKMNAQAAQLKEIYQDNKWKIQLLGDEGEYEGLYQSINKLIAAAKEEDTVNFRIELSTIRSFVEDIYSL